MFISSDRTLGKSFIFLVVMSTILAGLSAAVFLLVAPEVRTDLFWTSFWVILFALVLSFSYLIFHAVVGRDDFAPIPLLLGISRTVALYEVFVLVTVLICLFYPRLSLTACLAVHIAGFLVLVGGGGLITVLSLTARETDMGASLKRSRLFVQMTRVASLIDELSLSPFAAQASDLADALKKLRLAIQMTNPDSSDGLEVEELLVLAVDAVEEKTRRFLSSGSDLERRSVLGESAPLIEKAFNALRRGEAPPRTPEQTGVK